MRPGRCMVTMVLLGTLGCAGCVHPQPARDETLLRGVDMVGLMARLGVTAQIAGFDSRGVMYSPGKREKGITDEIIVGVFEDVAKAREAFGALSVTPVVGKTKPGEAVGDQYLYWSTQVQTTKRLLWRRGNAVLSYDFVGSDEELFATGREVDRLAAGGGGFGERVTVVTLPMVEVSAAATATTDRPIEVRFSLHGGGDLVQPAGAAVCRAGGGQVPTRIPIYASGGEFTSEGRGEIHLPRAGTYDLEIPFVTNRNLIFWKKLRLRVTAPGGSSEGAIQPWEVLGSSIYFIRNAGEQWGASLARDREWMAWDRGDLAPIVNEAEVVADCLKQLRGIMKDGWAPSPGVLHARVRGAKPFDETVFFAAYQVQRCHVVIMGVLGRGVMIYVERMPPAKDAPRLSDVVLPSMVGAPDVAGAAVWARKMVRLRSTDPKGPYEAAGILMAEIVLPDSLNLHLPGY